MSLIFLTTQRLEKWNAGDADHYDMQDFICVHPIHLRHQRSIVFDGWAMEKARAARPTIKTHHQPVSVHE